MDNIERQTQSVLENIANKIKYLRAKKQLSIYMLAKKAGIARSYASQIENMKRVPAIGTLVAIAHVLGVSVFFLLSEETTVEDERDPFIVKATERRLVKLPFRSLDISYESINYKAKDRLMDAYILTAPFKFSSERRVRGRGHEGEELDFVLEGKVEFLYGHMSYTLEEGDCCYFDANKPHNARSLGSKPSKVLAIFANKQ
jgi:transcriptional regulator with XRE-family HTH domain